MQSSKDSLQKLQWAHIFGSGEFTEPLLQQGKKASPRLPITGTDSESHSVNTERLSFLAEANGLAIILAIIL